MTTEEKGEWAEVADEGIVPVEDDDAAVTGRTVGGDEPATEEGIDLSAGDNADAVRDGGQNRPESGEEPDLRDAAAGPRQVDIDAAQS
jgi:hypothetical protein